MKRIYLTNGKGITLVDDEDYEWLNQYNWRLIMDSYTSTHIKINDKWTSKRMHRLIMNEPDGFDIDHIDRNGLNNQKSNLRIVSRSQNQMNRSSNKNSSSIYKGVCFRKFKNKYEASIKTNGKYYYIGIFENEIDAAKAYNKKAKELFKEYAYLNEV